MKQIIRSMLAGVLAVCLAAGGSFAGAAQNKSYVNLGKTDIYENSIKQIRLKENVLQVNDASIYLHAVKESIQKMSCSLLKSDRPVVEMMDGFSGSIAFKKGVKSWDGLPVKFDLAFYSQGKLVKQMRYLMPVYDSKVSEGFEFITPADAFDEIKVSAAVTSEEQLKKDLGPMSLEVKTVAEKEAIQELFFSNGNIAAFYHGNYQGIENFYGKHETFAKFVAANEGISFYPDGRNFMPFRQMMQIKDAPKNIPISFLIQGTYANWEVYKEGKVIKSVKVTLPKPQPTKRVDVYLLYDANYNVTKMLIIKP